MRSENNLKHIQRLLLEIPHGKVTTYKELATAMETRGYRYVGNLLHRNPEPDRFPCYKVVKSDGSLGGFALGQKEKIQRLRADGIEIRKGMIDQFPKKLHRF